MKKLLALVFAASLALPISAHAADIHGMYVAPKIGLGIQHFKSTWENGASGPRGNEAAFGGALAVGYDARPLRGELEYSFWSRAERKEHGREGNQPYNAKAQVGIQSLFANVYLDWHNDTAFTPYVGAGVGLGFVNTKAHEDVSGRYSAGYGSKSKTNLAWNVGLGCSYAFTDMISVDMGYRYASFGSGKTGSNDGDYLKSKNNTMHQFMLGARFTF